MSLSLEGHKLHLHPQRVALWLNGENISPVYAEIGPTSLCNHKCKMCAYDYLEHRNERIDKQRLSALMSELADLGVKAVCFAGDGEPFLNDGIYEAIEVGYKQGLDLAISTNGVLLDEKKLKEVLPCLQWIRFSVNGGNAEDYAAVHKASSDDFLKLKENMKKAAEIKQTENLKVVLGAQYILLSENKNSLLSFAEYVKKTGFDYFAVKPFYRNSNNKYSDSLIFNDEKELLCRVEALTNSDFKAVVRWETDATNNPMRKYNECYGQNFIMIIAASGDVFPCLPFQRPEYSFGNINDDNLFNIWQGQRRQDIMRKMNGLDKNKCQPNCRQHWINNYLWDIKNPPLHHNFI